MHWRQGSRRAENVWSDRVINWLSLNSPVQRFLGLLAVLGLRVKHRSERWPVLHRVLRALGLGLFRVVGSVSIITNALRVGLRDLRAARANRKNLKHLGRLDRAATAAVAGAGGRPIIHYGSTDGAQFLTFCGMAWQQSSWAIKLAGHPVLEMKCAGILTRCLGGRPGTLEQAPHCEACRELSTLTRDPTGILPLTAPSDDAEAEVERLASQPLAELRAMSYNGIAIGANIEHSVRWALQRYHLDDDAPTRRLWAHFTVSARRLADATEQAIDRHDPAAFVIFNGIFYPEATVRAVAQRRGIPVYTYEHGHLPKSMYFSREIACDVDLHVPADFQMSAKQRATLDAYLGARFKGAAAMGSVQFFPEVLELPADLVEKTKAYGRVVSVFPNVAFDTSHINANYLFSSMFDWVGEVYREAAKHPDALFVIRCHPSEARRQKPSLEPVDKYLERLGSQPNVHIISGSTFINSYELIMLSDLVMAYNSTVGVEALILGKPIINGGLPKYRNQPFFRRFGDKSEFFAHMAEQIASPAPISEAVREQARRFMYYLYFSTSLDYSRSFMEMAGARWLMDDKCTCADFHQDNWPEGRLLIKALFDGGSFYYD